MNSAQVAIAVRPGEHACACCAHAADWSRTAAAFLHGGIVSGRRVVYLYDGEDPATLAHDLVSEDDELAAALTRGQLELRIAQEAYTPDGRFDGERMIDGCAGDRRAARDAGYRGLAVAGEMTWVLREHGGVGALADYERRLDAMLGDPTMVNVCFYDQTRFNERTLAQITAAHQVEIGPELAAIGREGRLAAARRKGRLRLAGDLDFVSAERLARVVDATFPRSVELDLADLEFIDVAGMRGLRGLHGQRMTIVGASPPVRRLLELLGWDTDPGISLDRAS